MAVAESLTVYWRQDIHPDDTVIERCLTYNELLYKPLPPLAVRKINNTRVFYSHLATHGAFNPTAAMTFNLIAHGVVIAITDVLLTPL